MSQISNRPQIRRPGFAETVQLDFDDPDRMAATVPGGTFGILPLGGEAFRGTVRAAYLTNGVVARSTAFETPVMIRSQFAENQSTISFLLPCITGTVALLNGKEVDRNHLASSNGGVRRQFLTKAAHEVGTFTVNRDVLFSAIDVLGKHDVPTYLDHDANIVTDPMFTARLNGLYHKVSDLLGELSRRNALSLAENGIAILREAVLAELVSLIIAGRGKPDHLATWRQTEAMARIDRYIDEHDDQMFSLHSLCLDTGMALRTLEATIKSRTGLSASSYLRRRRLAMVRQTLLNPDSATNVTRTALRYGFLHLGRFAIEYRQAYGESPSATLAKATGIILSSG
jgi:AraC-like DNA-binding protein